MSRKRAQIALATSQNPSQNQTRRTWRHVWFRETPRRGLSVCFRSEDCQSPRTRIFDQPFQITTFYGIVVWRQVQTMARHKAFNREVALDKALQVFWRIGYEAASMQ